MDAKDPKIKKGALRWLLRETIGNLVLILILFGLVGRWDWWNGWALSAIYILWSLGSIIFILPVNPQMLAERSRPQKGAKKWDLVMVSMMAVFLFATYIVACLDVRFGWATPFPLWVQITGFAAAVLGYDVILMWSMVSNAYFTAIIRIQSDRQHTVATGGPYRFVRHPGYVGTILCYLATPFLLGSPWAVIPAVLAAGVLVVRTGLEDKTLQAELPGYQEYTQQTRFRLIPGIW
ncbi:MAG: isoprenylcysteine carboxyl methyltransferase [Chloroflexi bacterium HGW-Chloroflexi-6]|nr:MAG: isoprenylcysteine carboxyl methyltransferase [Chloroflexi bacterium HGW-Chloroflexi-6]